MELWFTERHTPYVNFSIKVERQLYTAQSEFQRIDVFESREFGRFLTLDGYMMLTEKDEFIYHEMITHIPMAVHPNPENILVIGAGDGGVVRELTLYQSPKCIDLVEIDRCRVLVFAADNGVTAEGVSATPVSVTLSQSINMTRHITGMSALAAAFGDSVVVTDVGIDADVRCPEIVDRKIRRLCREIVEDFDAPAMTREQALTAISVGMEQAQRAAQDGMQAVGIGEMGIGNTTTSAAVLAALIGLAPEELTGRGAGLTDDAFRKKKDVIRRALTLHRPDPADPVGVLAAVGGLDLAAMTGAFLGLAAAHVPAVADGLISVVAALCAVRLCPAARDAIFLSHASKEPGYRRAAEELGLAPFLQLGMRLGEGSGCPLAFQVLKAACAVMNGMATFVEAAINDDYLESIRTPDAFRVDTP